jgi:23S rRNA (cytidine1920-2'-O)/16S rRNA (cytidine1409-2'-O)-methyltransferase
MKRRLDQVLFLSGKTQSRSRAEDLIKRGTVRVNGNVITKPAFEVSASDKIVVSATAGKYVSRAGEKLASVARELGHGIW